MSESQVFVTRAFFPKVVLKNILQQRLYFLAYYENAAEDAPTIV